MHLRLSEHAKALRLPAERAKSEVHSAELQIQRKRFERFRIRGELGRMAKERFLLELQKSPRLHKPVRFCGHVERQRFYIRGFGAVLRRQFMVRCKVRRPPCRFPDVSVIRVTLAFHVRVRRKDHLRLRLADHAGDAALKIRKLVKSAVGKVQKAHVGHAEQFCGSDRLRLSDLFELVRRRALRRGLEPVASVGADQKRDLLSRGSKLCRRRARADLDVVRVRSDEQVAVERLHLRRRRSKAQRKSSQAHASLLSLRALSSAQMRSYSGSSS